MCALVTGVLSCALPISGMPLVHIARASQEALDGDDPLASKVLACVSIGVRRTFEHDPRFGLSVLSEIASRALSSAVNDSGTAIDVLGRGVRSLACWGTFEPHEAATPPECDRVFLHGDRKSTRLNSSH